LFKISKIILAVVAIGSFLFGLYLYTFVCNLEWYKAVYNSLSFFALNFNECANNSTNLLYIPALKSGVITFYAVIVLFLKIFNVHSKQLLMCMFGGHTIVVGLGSNNRYYLDSEIASGNSKIIIIENNPAKKTAIG